MFEMRNVEAGYGKIKILQGTTLQVNPGEIVGLIGRNGVGKTTTLKTIMGLNPITAGSITFEGRDLAKTPPHHIPRHGVGYVPQGRGIFPTLTVWENLCLGLQRRPPEDDLADVYRRFPRLKERLGQPAGTLSGGEQQMLAIGRCIIMRPKLMLLDEPTEGVMPILVKSIQSEIESINGSGVAMLLVEQNVKAAARLCDRVYVMEKGRIVHQADANLFKANPEILSERMGLGGESRRANQQTPA